MDHSELLMERTGLSAYELAIVTECTVRVPRSRIVYIQGNGYFLDHARFGKRELICNLQIENLIRLGYLSKNRYGGVVFTLKCEDLYDDLIMVNKVQSKLHPNKMVDSAHILFGVEL